MDGNPPAKASDKGSIPVPGRLHICRATKPVHNYWAGTLGSMSHNYPICVPHLLKPTHLEPALHSKGGPEMRSLCTTTKSSPRLLQIEKAHAKQWRPSTAKNKTTEKKKKNIWFFLHHPDSSFMTNTWFPGLTIPRPVKEDIPTSPKLYSDGGGHLVVTSWERN